MAFTRAGEIRAKARERTYGDGHGKHIHRDPPSVVRTPGLGYKRLARERY
jgi:hypothetical protein